MSAAMIGMPRPSPKPKPTPSFTPSELLKFFEVAGWVVVGEPVEAAEVEVADVEAS